MAKNIQQLLVNYAKEHEVDPNRVYIRYILERFLYRLSISEYNEQYALKGAMLFALWTDMPIRYTRDIDLLGFKQEDLESISHVFKKICTLTVPVEDKVLFDAESLVSDFIRENSSYGGIRIELYAKLDGVKRSMPVQIDVGFGDRITPHAEVQSLSTILDFPAPKLTMLKL